MQTEMKIDDVAIFGDIRITAMPNGLKIQMDKGSNLYQWMPISEIEDEMDADKILVKTESGKITRLTDDLPFEIATHFMLLE